MALKRMSFPVVCYTNPSNYPNMEYFRFLFLEPYSFVNAVSLSISSHGVAAFTCGLSVDALGVIRYPRQNITDVSCQATYWPAPLLQMSTHILAHALAFKCQPTYWHTSLEMARAHVMIGHGWEFPKVGAPEKAQTYDNPDYYGGLPKEGPQMPASTK